MHFTTFIVKYAVGKGEGGDDMAETRRLKTRLSHGRDLFVCFQGLDVLKHTDSILNP